MQVAVTFVLKMSKATHSVLGACLHAQYVTTITYTHIDWTECSCGMCQCFLLCSSNAGFCGHTSLQMSVEH